MAYRKFKASRLFNGYHFRNADDVLITTADGTIEAIVPLHEAGDDVEQLQGILTPGLINCHCHLELSHLKNVIPPHTGLIEFLCSVVTKRGFAPEIIEQEIERAEAEMYNNGIVAVGDIGNTADTASTKAKSKIRWQNFVEVLSFTDEKADENFNHYKNVSEELEQALRTSYPVPRTSDFVPRTSLVPHAPYSISPKTFELINAATKNQIISIHNQEHPAEDELYKTGSGEYVKLFKIFGMNASPFPVTGKSSIRSVLPHFNNGQTIFLIHNTFMPEQDIVWANEYAAANGLKLVYCLCINANLYIENKTPPADLFIKHNCHLVLGTDSYSSNWQLSIAKEMQSLLQHSTFIQEQVLQMATINGAKAFKWDNDLGSFEKRKRPGVVLLKEDFSESIKVL
ncbi:MAG: amidohydrolase family protein [Chitinophagaceae bacterium]|nr:amidohydrolase family protein [Chitinophagaceae bacterium]